MNVETVQSQLRKLLLTTAARELHDVLARRKKAVSLEWMSELLERELDSRKERGIQKRIQRAGFPEVTSLASFDWRFNPKIDRKRIEALSKLEFVKDHGIALLLGPPGVGKTHVASAIGVRAAREGYRVYCTSAKQLIRRITVAKAQNRLDLLFKRMLSSQLWIIDDWGVVTMGRDIAEEVFDLLDQRRYSAAMILTSNRDVSEWGEMFADPVLANATIDRIFDRAEIVTFKGKSYRLKGRIRGPKIDEIKNKE